MAISAARRQPATPAAVSSRAHEQATKRYPVLGTEPFMPLPAPRGARPYRLELANVLPPASREAIERDHAPIFAIPGNHDGDLEPGSGARSLEAFVGQFCAPEAIHVPSRGPSRNRTCTGPCGTIG
jgi:hypothetical protein